MSCISIGETAPCATLEITQGELRAIGWQLKNQDGTPVLVAGYGARLHIRERMNSPVALLELSDGAGLRLVDGICWFEPTLAQINGLQTGNIRQDWVYDLFLEQPAASPIMVAQGKAIVYPRVTRWQAPEPSSISPDPVLIEAIVAGLQGPKGDKGDKGDAGSGGMDAATYDPQNIEADAFARENHTGTQPMSSIGDKQGKVLDDRIPISNWEDVRDGITTKGGYLLENDGTNGYLTASLVDVVETGGVVAQVINSPLLGQRSRVYTEDDGWSEYILHVTSLTVMDWYSVTTAEAANAVINADGTFSRSLFVPAPLAPKITIGLTAEADTDILRPSALTAATTFPNPTGTPIDGFGFVIELIDDGTARALTWGSDYAAGFAALPTTTTAGKLGQIAIQYRGGKYRCDGVRWMA